MPLFQIRFRRDTTANWQAANPILLDGEVGYERTENGLLLIKMGDGVMGADGIITGTPWNDLPYVSSPAGPTPEHEWQETSLRFRNPDGSWGETVQLKGADGPVGPQGPPGLGGPLMPAAKTGLGGVIVGEGLDVDENGCLSVGAHASETPDAYGKGDFQLYGHVKLTDDFEQPAAAGDGVGISPVGVRRAWDRIMRAKEQVSITISQTWIAPETATYSVTCVGGGGMGGKGGNGLARPAVAPNLAAGGGGGGGGGAGQVVVRNIRLTRGTEVACVIGGSGGQTKFGAYVTALAGSPGGNGSVGVITQAAAQGGLPGGGGITHGSTAAPGTRGSAAKNTAAGGAGGLGGISSWSPHGNGGRGGKGGNVTYPNAAAGAAGAPGAQGRIVISILVGG